MIRRLRTSRLPRVGFVLLALGFCGYGLATRWPQVTTALAQLSWWAVGGALLTATAGLVAQMLAWRALLADLGSPLPARTAFRVQFVGQLGKYVPGSVWAFVATMELARRHRVPRVRGVTATVLAMMVTFIVGAAVAAVTLPLAAAGTARHYWWAITPGIALLAVLHPRVLAAVANPLLRLARRPPLDRTVSLQGMVRASAWTLVAWALFGCHAWLLVAAAGGRGAAQLPLAVGAYALAWAVGFVVVIAPGGAGAREAALVAALAPTLAAGPALVVALVSRVVMTLADFSLAGLAILAGGRQPADAPDTPQAQGRAASARVST